MGVAHSGMGHMDGVVASGIDVIYSSQLMAVVVLGSSSSGRASRPGSSLCTSFRCRMRLLC